jgi:phosphatidylinositol glycan class V
VLRLSRLLSSAVFAPLVPVLGYRAALVISGHVLNNVAFVASAGYFYRSLTFFSSRKLDFSFIWCN